MLSRMSSHKSLFSYKARLFIKFVLQTSNANILIVFYIIRNNRKRNTARKSVRGWREKTGRRAKLGKTKG